MTKLVTAGCAGLAVVWAFSAGAQAHHAMQDIRVPPALDHYVAPIYPEEAKAAGIKGIVTIQATIDNTGHVTEASVLHSEPALDAAALTAVKQWTYKPATMNGKPVSTTAVISVAFPPRAAPFDITGRWLLESSTLGEGVPRVDGAFGDGFEARQSELELIVESPALVRGRGGVPGPPIHVTYRFDGSKTNLNDLHTVALNSVTGQMASQGSTLVMWSTASWIGSKLQILFHEERAGVERVSSQIELWQEADGTLLAERSINPPVGRPGGAQLAWHARYRRAAH